MNFETFIARKFLNVNNFLVVQNFASVFAIQARVKFCMLDDFTNTFVHISLYNIHSSNDLWLYCRTSDSGILLSMSYVSVSYSHFLLTYPSMVVFMAHTTPHISYLPLGLGCTPLVRVLRTSAPHTYFDPSLLPPWI